MVLVRSDLMYVPGVDAYESMEVAIGPECHNPGCRGYGNIDSGILFLGIAPGRDEVRTGRPLTGPSGQLLNQILQAIDFPRHKTYATNLICWWKDDPNQKEMDKCSERLHRELSTLKPKLIVLLGSIVSERFIGRPIGQARGAVQWNVQYGCYVMATYHPSAILRGMGDRTGSGRDDRSSVMIYDLVRDLLKIKDVLTWSDGAPQAQISYTIVNDPITAQTVLNQLPRIDTSIPCAIDVETTSAELDEVDVFKDQLMCVGIATPEQAWVFTPDALFNRVLSEEDDFDPVLRPYEIVPALTWPNNVRWTMHNALFDVQVMKRALDVWIDVREDTMLQSYSLDERPGVHSLKPLAREYLGAGWWEEERKAAKTKWKDTPRDLLYKYNAHDAIYTARLCTKFTERQIEDNVRDVYLNIMMPCVNTFKEIQYRGVKIDESTLGSFGVVWAQMYDKMETELQQMAQDIGWPSPTINLNAPGQLAKLLYELIGLPCTVKTRKGAQSTNVEALEALEGLHPFIDKFKAFRKLAKMYDSYIINMQGHLKDDGRAHPIVKLHGTVTGRTAYAKPPVQQIPAPYSDETTFGRLRQMFVASNDTYEIVEADYGKAEVYWAQTLSQDLQMLADLQSGDYHRQVATSVYKCTADEVSDEQRRQTKRVVFGTFYGIEEVSLSKQVHSSIPEARQFIRNFLQRNKDYAKWYNSTVQEAVQEGELASLTGRKRRFLVVGSANRAAKQAVNFPVQSNASDCTITSLIELHSLLRPLGAYILFTVHDSIVFEVPKSRRDECIRIIHDTMTRIRFPGAPQLPVEIGVGKSWGTTKKIHDCTKHRRDTELDRTCNFV